MKAHLKTGIINDLIDHGLIKFSETGFELNGGKKSPVYIEIRDTQSYPKLADKITSAYLEVIQESKMMYDHITAVPYGALQQGFLVAKALSKPVLTPRKEEKSHGSGGDIVGIFQKNQKSLIIEDVASEGNSVLKVVHKLHKKKIEVTDVVVLIDREAGAKKKLFDEEISLHSYMTLADIIDVVEIKNKISPSMLQKVKDFYDQNRL